MGEARNNSGDRDRGGGDLRKLEGVKIMNFQGTLKLTLFYRDSKENRQFGGQSPSLRGATFGASPPPSSVWYVLTPPPPSLVSDNWQVRKCTCPTGTLEFTRISLEFHQNVTSTSLENY